jgi:hypothetical protein
MRISWEYHVPVMDSTFSARTCRISILLIGLLATLSHAQINGAPASVSSPGFGGRTINGTPSSVTSLGPRGYAPAPTFSGSLRPNRNRNGDHRHHADADAGGAILYAVPVPYAVSNDVRDDSDDGGVDPEYQGGPTLFDRRGPGNRSYEPLTREYASSSAGEFAGGPPPDKASEDPTLLVFKDGHKLEVGNYAIVGGTLFDLTPGHSRRVPLAELDLVGTRKQNDDRGVVFQLPASLQAN